MTKLLDHKVYSIHDILTNTDQCLPVINLFIGVSNNWQNKYILPILASKWCENPNPGFCFFFTKENIF